MTFLEKPSLLVSAKETVRGLMGGIPYEIRNPSGDWTPYYGKWESQKRNGIDYQICWNNAGVEVTETQLQFLLATNRFSKVSVDWFKLNGYIDEDGDFFLSRRWIATISGKRFEGNDEAEYWRLLETYGAIPQKLFPHKDGEDYFDQSKLTDAMYSLGKEFLTHVKIQHEELGTRFTQRDTDMLRSALFQAPLQIGVPVPKDVSKWNSKFIQWDGTKKVAHSVEVRKIDGIGQIEIFNSYNPPMKTLSFDYRIPIITRAVITPRLGNPNPVSQETLGAKIWRAIFDFFGRLPV